jgi:hypothetical protein
MRKKWRTEENEKKIKEDERERKNEDETKYPSPVSKAKEIYKNK